MVTTSKIGVVVAKCVLALTTFYYIYHFQNKEEMAGLHSYLDIGSEMLLQETAKLWLECFQGVTSFLLDNVVHMGETSV